MDASLALSTPLALDQGYAVDAQAFFGTLHATIVLSLVFADELALALDASSLLEPVLFADL